MLIGIDLGTTYSVGAYIDQEGTPQVIDSKEGGKTIPSVVFFDSDNSIIVGDVAKEHSVINGQDVITAVKNHMGKKIVLRKQNDIEYNPEMISSFILRKVIQDAENAIGEEVTGVVITVPAYFTDAQRMATKHACCLAGVELVGMINEPTAAALCYVRKNRIKNSNILVYDLGGGTFDVTIMHVGEQDQIEVLSTGGLSNAGGRFFDQYIVDYVVDFINEKYDVDLEDDEYCDELQELYLKAELVKMQLSNRNSASIILKIGKIKEQVEITKEQFDGMIHKVYIRTESKVQDALKQANLTVNDIDKVLLIGGSSRIPYVVEHIQKFTDKVPSKEINPDEAVAIGAAIYGKILEKHQKVLVDVCSHSIGVVVKGKSGEDENEIIIPRNTKLPAEREERFRTMVDNQKVIRLTVTEGEYKELSDVTVIGEFAIDIPTRLRAGSLAFIKIALDQEQLIRIRMALPDAGFEEEYCIKRNANMDEKEVVNATGILRDYQIN